MALYVYDDAHCKHELNNVMVNRNLLINGDFKVWQRGTTFTFNGNESFIYHADRWCVYASQGQKINIVKTNEGMRISGTSGIIQRMEYPLCAGKKYAISSSIDGDIKSMVVTGGEYSENDYFKYSKSGVYEQILIKANGITNIRYAKLEQGSDVTAFQEKSEGETLAECLRFYEMFIPRRAYGVGYNTSFASLIYPFLVPKRIAPTVIMSEVRGDALREMSNRNLTPASLIIETTTSGACNIRANASGLTPSFGYSLDGGIIGFDSELR